MYFNHVVTKGEDISEINWFFGTIPADDLSSIQAQVELNN